jgi:diadenosine tetraphosphate (Ap4A) HIT family hydrolase
MYTCVEDLSGEKKDGCAACGQTAPMPSRGCPVDWSAPRSEWAMTYDITDHRWRPKCTVVYALEEPPEGFYKSVFLAGPTPRSMDVKSWRPEAIYILMALGYDGVIFVPEPRDGKWGEYDHQTDWEKRCRNLARIILYWIPRDMATMPGLTTNNEWGNDNDSGKAVLGTPPEAKSVRYQHKEAREYGVPLADTLEQTVRNALELMDRNVRADCVFCQIAGPDPRGQVEWRGHDSVVITPLSPVVPGHRLVIPRIHVRDAFENPNVFARTMRDAARYVYDDIETFPEACNIITSVGEAATQTVFHLHVHLVPRAYGDGLHLPWTGQKR